MKLRHWMAAALVAAAALPAGADDLRGYVTQIEVASSPDGIRIWVAPEKGIKGPRDLTLDVQDPMTKWKIDLARYALARRLPVRISVGDKGQVTSLALRYYPSSRQLPGKEPVR